MSQQVPPTSPLDPFLSRFLAAVQDLADGIQPGAELRALAEQLDVPEPFMETLFTSARKRGLLKPAYGRGNKVRWKVAPGGRAMVDQAAMEDEVESSRT